MVDLILVPVDFSPASLRALDVALGLAQRTGGRVEILHCYELPALVSPDGAVIAGAELTAQIMQDSRARLSSLVKAREDAGVEVGTHTSQGPVFSAILDRAKAVEASMIVMGTHGRSGLPRLLLGSVAEKVIRTAEVPVLVVREVHDGE